MIEILAITIIAGIIIVLVLLGNIKKQQDKNSAVFELSPREFSRQKTEKLYDDILANGFEAKMINKNEHFTYFETNIKGYEKFCYYHFRDKIFLPIAPKHSKKWIKKGYSRLINVMKQNE